MLLVTIKANVCRLQLRLLSAISELFRDWAGKEMDWARLEEMDWARLDWARLEKPWGASLPPVGGNRQCLDARHSAPTMASSCVLVLRSLR